MKSVSFDLWGTLIKSNPEFKPRRDKYIFDNYGLVPDYGFLGKKARAIEKMVDQIGEGTGQAVDAKILIALILKELGQDLTKFDKGEYYKIERDLLDLALEFPPLYYDENTLPVLNWLKEEGYTVVTASNTGLLSGITMRWVQNQIKLDKLVKDQVYSDIVGYSKPHINFFQRVDSVLGTEQYLHVGDNANADGGAKYPFIINSNDLTILDVKKYLETEPQSILSESFH